MIDFSKFTKNEINQINVELEIIQKKFFGIVKSKNASDFLNDVRNFDKALQDKSFLKSKKSFLSMFIKKYQLKDLSKLCHGYENYMEIISRFGINIFDSEFDLISTPVNPKAVGLGFLWHLWRLIRALWLQFIVFFVGVIFMFLSHYSYNMTDLPNNEWWSDLWLALATSVFAGIVISSFNKYFRNKRMKYENQLRSLSYKNNQLKAKVQNEISEYRKRSNKRNQECVKTGVDITNLLYSYFSHIGFNISLKTCSAYYRFRVLFKEFDAYVGDIVRREFPDLTFSKLSKNEIELIDEYITKVEFELDEYLSAMERVSRYYNIDIQFVSDKQI